MITLQHAGRNFELECVDTLAGIHALEEEWHHLESVCAEQYLYFQTYDWCSKWCDEYAATPDSGGENVPQIMVLRHLGQVAMIWPLMTVKSRAGVKVLVTLGEPLGQYSGLQFDPDLFSVQLGRSVFEHIQKISDCDAFTLNFFTEDSMLSRILGNSGFSDQSQQKSSILDLDMFETWDEYVATLPSKHRKQRNKRRNRLNSLGKVTYDVHSSSSSEFSELVDICLDMKQQWMEATGRREDVMSDDGLKRFLAALGDETSRDAHNDIYMHVLRIDGAPAGLELGMASKGHYYSYLGAINLDYQKHSPGKIQMEFAQQWALELGLSKFDFLNDPSDYKASWTNITVPLRSQYIPITSAGYLYCWMWKTSIRPKLKELYKKTSANERRYFNQLFQMIGKIQGTKEK